jgi:type IV pilus assembly protein PilB
MMTPPFKLRDAIISRASRSWRSWIFGKAPAPGRPHHDQDGTTNGRKKALDFRVSVLPTLFGEKIVMRLLDKENLMLDMTKLGFEQESLAKFKAIFSVPGAWCW